jgi:hypothetical protein
MSTRTLLHIMDEIDHAEDRGDLAAVRRLKDEQARRRAELDPPYPGTAPAAAPVPAAAPSARPQGSRFANLFGGTPCPTPKATRPATARANPAHDALFTGRVKE